MADSDTIVSAWNSAHDNEQQQQQQRPQQPQPQPQQETSSRVPRRVCAACRRRKVGCDKKQPCQHCSKSGTECVYPPEHQTSDERHMFRDAGLLERLHRLEPMLKTLASCMEQGALLPSATTTSSISSSSAQPQSHPPAHRDTARENTALASTRASPAPPTPPRSVGSGSTGNRPDYRLAGPEHPATMQAPSPLGHPSPLRDADLAGARQSTTPGNPAAGGLASQGVSPKEMSGLVESPYGTSMGKLVRDDGRQRYVSGTFWEALHTEVINYVQPISRSLLTSLISSSRMWTRL